MTAQRVVMMFEVPRHPVSVKSVETIVNEWRAN